MKKFALMIGMVAIIVLSLSISKKIADEAYATPPEKMQKTCGTYIEKTQVKNSRGSVSNFLTIESEGKKYKFTLTYRTIFPEKNPNIGQPACVRHTDFSVNGEIVAMIIE